MRAFHLRITAAVAATGMSLALVPSTATAQPSSPTPPTPPGPSASAAPAAPAPDVPRPGHSALPGHRPEQLPSLLGVELPTPTLSPGSSTRPTAPSSPTATPSPVRASAHARLPWLPSSPHGDPPRAPATTAPPDRGARYHAETTDPEDNDAHGLLPLGSGILLIGSGTALLALRVRRQPAREEG